MIQLEGSGRVTRVYRLSAEVSMTVARSDVAIDWPVRRRQVDILRLVFRR
jgi:hypothetical protein